MAQEYDREPTKTAIRIIGRGAPILILHGWGGTSLSWMKVQDMVAEKGYLVAAPDIPGFGKSNPPETPWGLQEYIGWVSDLVKTLGNGPITIVGHSFGGRLAIKFTHLYPERVSKIVLISAAGIKPPRTWRIKLLETVAKIGRIFSFLPLYEIGR